MKLVNLFIFHKFANYAIIAPWIQGSYPDCQLRIKSALFGENLKFNSALFS
jgi:hypothetical protein